MYHIKSDKRAQVSAQLIGNAMMELLKVKNFDDISVSDIQRQSTVGRATFYRLFDNTVDVLSWLCNQIFDTMTNRNALPTENMVESMISFIGTWMEHEVLLQAIIRSGHIEVIYEMLYRRMKEAGDLLFPDLQLENGKADYLVSIASTAMIGGLSAWLKHGKTESAEQVFENIREVIGVFHQLTEKQAPGEDI